MFRLRGPGLVQVDAPTYAQSIALRVQTDHVWLNVPLGIAVPLFELDDLLGPPQHRGRPRALATERCDLIHLIWVAQHKLVGDDGMCVRQQRRGQRDLMDAETATHEPSRHERRLGSIDQEQVRVLGAGTLGVRAGDEAAARDEDVARREVALGKIASAEQTPEPPHQ